jgi:enterochelin esterase family protein
MNNLHLPSSRYIGIVAIVLLTTAPAAAQDMALGQILIDEGDWRRSENSAHPLLRSSDPKRVETKSGGIYLIDDQKRVVYLPRKGADEQKKVVAENFLAPSALILWPDQTTLVVADAEDKYLWAFRIEPDGQLTGREQYYPLRLPRLPAGQKESGARSMAFDTAGRLYVATTVGVQIFDPTGRLSGVLPMPNREPATAVAFGGPRRDILAIGCGDKTYIRQLKASGIK